MLSRLVSMVAFCALLAAGAAVAEPRVSAFYYPWYGNPAVDGVFLHWQQNGAAPPARIASAFYPVRGAYSSADRLVVAAQMREIRAAGIEQVAVSWWGPGSIEDSRLPAVAAAARAAGLDVAVHTEPYGGRTAASTAADIAGFRALGVRDVFVYAPTDVAAEEWAAMNAGLDGVRVFAQTGLAGYAAAGGFDGLYTYDIVNWTGDKFARLCEQARRRKLLCAPSVGPGYDARRAASDPRVRPRRGGATYDSMWRLALGARADLVTITSYNEWHEGTQIEPARARPGYRGYDGAWALHGRSAERAYLDRTALWAARLSRRSVPR